MLTFDNFPKYWYNQDKNKHSVRGYQSERSVCNLLKYIGKLLRTEKEQVYQWVKRYVEPSSIVGGILINAMRGTYDSLRLAKMNV
ncbi:hypothetical protein BTA31_08380 [Bacillus haynesii]|uniref:Transposase n=1 Tax=Bacillus haynesii TaxID=1925021 RepID=A0ABX3I5W8_9BACI|nr:hypothetical protein BTA31_08380 [Bacillus haynesii]